MLTKYFYFLLSVLISLLFSVAANATPDGTVIEGDLRIIGSPGSSGLVFPDGSVQYTASSASSQDVNVINTPTVNVGNASLPVTGTVGISGTPDVNITNSSLSVTPSPVKTVMVAEPNLYGPGFISAGSFDSSIYEKCKVIIRNQSATDDATVSFQVMGTLDSPFIVPANSVYTTMVELPINDTIGLHSNRQIVVGVYCR
jgi:hypothetical protein